MRFAKASACRTNTHEEGEVLAANYARKIFCELFALIPVVRGHLLLW